MLGAAAKGLGLFGAGSAGLYGAAQGLGALSRGPEQQPSNVPPALQPGLAPSMPMLTGPSSMARYGVPMAPVPPKQNIGTNEMLARAGGAIMSNASKGGPAAYGAGLEAYGSMMDQNRELERQSAVDQYNAAAAQQSALSKMPQSVAPMDAGYTTAALTALEKIETSYDHAASTMNPLDDVAGFWGTVMKVFPGSNASDVKSSIQTVVSSIGFDRLQAMRDASPTGGALGQVSERELSQLNASIGNLEQSQSGPQFRDNVRIVKAQLQRTIYFMNLRVQQYNNEIRGMAPSSNATPQQLYAAYSQSIGGGSAQPAQPQQAAPAAPAAPAAAATPAAPAASPQAASGISAMAPASPAAATPAAPQGTSYTTGNGVTVTRVP